MLDKFNSFHSKSHKESSSGLFFKIHIAINNLVITKAVKTEVIIPIYKVTAKPLTGPVPRKNKTSEKNYIEGEYEDVEDKDGK